MKQWDCPTNAQCVVTVIPSNLFCIYNLIPALISPCCCPQLFLHSVFGYRGIVLFPWHARLYDRDITPPMSDRWASLSRLQQTLVFGLNHVTMKCLSCCSKREPPGAHGSKEVKGKTHTYYQVLIDTRDCPHIVSHCLLLSNDDLQIINRFFWIDDAVCLLTVGLFFSLSGLRQKRWHSWPTTMTVEPCTPSQVWSLIHWCTSL